MKSSFIQLKYCTLDASLQSIFDKPVGLAYFSDADGNEKPLLCDIPAMRDYRFDSEDAFLSYKAQTEWFLDFSHFVYQPTSPDGKMFLSKALNTMLSKEWLDWLYAILKSSTFYWKDGVMFCGFQSLRPYGLSVRHNNDIHIFNIAACIQEPEPISQILPFNVLEYVEDPDCLSESSGPMHTVFYHHHTLIPLIWNDTQQTAGVFRYGDMLKIRFVCPDSPTVHHLGSLSDWDPIYRNCFSLFPINMPDLTAVNKSTDCAPSNHHKE